MNKNLIFSHESDIDGLGCIVLGKLAFKDIDYVLVPNIDKLEQVFRKYIDSNDFDKYKKIYVTDLALYNPSLTLVSNSPLKNKVLIFDHHQRAIDDKMNKFDFTTIIEEDEQGKKCGTQLFYEYLIKENYIKETIAIKEFVELTRLEDTWEWKKAGNTGKKAHDLAILFNALGIEKYISTMQLKLLDNPKTFEFSKEELSLIQEKKNEYNELLKEIMTNAEYFLDENDNKFGAVFADYEYRNELAEYIQNNGNKENIKYFIVMAMNKGQFGQKSYRSIDKDFDVNEVAVLHGGGGHKGAASVNITEEQKAKVLTLSKKDGLKYLANCKFTK